MRCTETLIHSEHLSNHTATLNNKLVLVKKLASKYDDAHVRVPFLKYNGSLNILMYKNPGEDSKIK